MRITTTFGSLLLLAAAPAANAQGAYPFFLDVDVCWSQPGNFANRGTQCDPATAPYGYNETIVMVEAGGVLTQCTYDNYGGPGWIAYNTGTWSKSNNQVVMYLPDWGWYLTGALAGGGTSGGVVVDSYGLATPVQSQIAAWDGVKSTQQQWDVCVNGGGGAGGLVGSYMVQDGPHWTTAPPVYTCQESCAMSFGGIAGDYQCSTNPYTIDNSAFASTWGYGCFVVAQDFSLSQDGSGTYVTPGDVSAFVSDHCLSYQTNYCFQ